MLATVHMETLRDTPVARIEGEVDASNAKDLTRRLTESVPNSAMGLVLDLSLTSYLDSSGIQMLVEVADGLRRRQQELRLVVAEESFVADVLASVNLGTTARRDATIGDALAALRPS
jgi:anti-anti-sigma factor